MRQSAGDLVARHAITILRFSYLGVKWMARNFFYVLCCWVLLYPFSLWAQNDLPQRIDELIRQLGDPDFNIRQHATQELEKIGEPALPALRQALNHKDPEVVWRAQTLITRISAKSRTESADPESEDSKIRPDKESPLDGEEREYEWEGPGFSFSFKYRPIVEEKSNLIVLKDDIRYEYLWGNGALKITVENLQDHTTQNYEVSSTDELKEKHPNLYQIYIEHGGNSLLKKQLVDPWKLPRQLPPEIRNYFPDMEKQLEELDREMQKNLPKIYRWEEKMKEHLAPFEESLPGNEECYGVAGEQASEAMKYHLALSGDEGLLITAVYPGKGCLAQSGVQKWDIVLKVEDIPIRSMVELRKAVESIPKGACGKMLLIRQGLRIELIFTR